MREMEVEKGKLEEMAESLRHQSQQTNHELELTTSALKELEAEREKLSDQQNNLSQMLEVGQHCLSVRIQKDTIIKCNTK